MSELLKTGCNPDEAVRNRSRLMSAWSNNQLPIEAEI
jgi:hypothetical protein